MNGAEEGDRSRRRRVLDALSFQLSLQFWIAVLSSIFGALAVLVWFIR